MAVFACTAFILSHALPFYRDAARWLLAQPGYFVELESLRGILALSVFIHHAMVWYFLPQTHRWTAPPSNFYSQMAVFPVSMFFFLTGFLFWSKLLRKPKLLWSDFMRARLRRLGPAYLLTIILLFVIVADLTGFRLHVSLPKLFLSCLAWALYDFGGTPDINGLRNTIYLLVVIGTLRLEWMFYTLLPLLGWFARRTHRALFLIGASAVVYEIAILIYGSQFRFFGLGTTIWFLSHVVYTFSVGIVTACLMARYNLRRIAQSPYVTCGALACLSLVLWRVRPEYGLLESTLLAPLFLAVAAGNSFGILRKRAFLFLGQISYSIYLLHCLVLAATIIPLQRAHSQLLENPVWYLALICFMGIGVILLATVSHRFVESPFLSISKKKTGSSPLPSSVAPAPALS
jgi:peptidoglycan/LPS O-acetylase OafA/YrhL